MKFKITSLLICLSACAYALEITDSLYINEADNVVNMVLSESVYNEWIEQDGFSNGYVRVITKKLYEHFEDDFDVIMLISNEQTKPSTISYYGINIAVANSVKGIGKSTFSNSKIYGSNGKLISVMHLPYVNAIKNGPTLHEFCHCWANFAIPSVVSGHWGICGGNTKGQLGGFKQSSLKTNVDNIENKYSVESFGTNANGGNSVPYNEMELYLMGMLPIDAVSEFDAFPTVDKESLGYEDEEHTRYTFISDNRVHYTQAKIIEDLGKREPDYTTSQKDFKALFVVISPAPLTSEEWSKCQSGIEWFCKQGDDGNNYYYNFWEATNGVGTIDPTGLSKSIKQSKTYKLTLLVNDELMGQVSGAGEYTAGTSVEIHAIANEGYHFVNWSDGIDNETRTITLNSDTTLTAYFEENKTMTAIEDSAGEQPSNKSQKTMRNGHIYIIKDGREYDAQGRELR